MIIVLKGERPVSWNRLNARLHWTKRKELVDRAHMIVLAAILDQHPDVEPFNTRVRITVRSYFKNRPTDPDNICDKLYIDGLRGRVIHDDTMQYVAGVTTESYIDKDNPRLEIELTEVNDE
jgi:Holliday junction resolvase RusA-like endonuclease